MDSLVFFDLFVYLGREMRNFSDAVAVGSAMKPCEDYKSIFRKTKLSSLVGW